MEYFQLMLRALQLVDRHGLLQQSELHFSFL
uniref:Uncharacterized protein n=1 Tax=Rhizophora mucronata TaxID=61149 RepID=A0A2P2Q6V7_RHIMU